MNRKQASSFTTGLLIVVVGLILLSSQMHLFWLGGMATLWPLVFFVIGIGHIARASGEGRWRTGLWWFFLGSLFLLHTTRTLTLHNSWPLFIVWFGVSVLLGKTCREGRDRDRHRTEPPQTPATPDIVVPRQP